MPLHDYRCPACGAVLTDQYRSVTEGAKAHPPWCFNDVAHPIAAVCMEPIPGFRLGLFKEFEKTTIPVEDPGSPTGFRQETITTLADIRRLEAQSEQRERNGEGRRMVWRDFSQDPSNQHTHTLMADPSIAAPKFYSNGTPVKVRRGDPVIADHGALAEDAAHEAQPYIDAQGADGSEGAS